MSPVPDRLVELRRHVEHLIGLRPQVATADALRRDLSLHNDVLFSLLTVCQLVIDIAGELSARRGLRFEDYTSAVRNLSSYREFPADLVTHLERLPGFREVLIHDYVALDLDRVVEALRSLEPAERFVEAVWVIEGSGARISLPAAWRRTVTGGPMPDVVAAIESARSGR